jgi:hypothetical protein
MDDNATNPEGSPGKRPEGKENRADGKSSDEDDAAAFWGDPVYVYTRRQAIEDGVLVDVSETAREAGFRWPLAVTAEVWAMIETIPKAHSHEDVKGRLWDVQMVAFANIRTARETNLRILEFDVVLHHAEGDRVRLKLVSGPGDRGEPVLTLMLPWQD